MRLPTLCFWSLEPRKFERGIRGNAEVDATGRYITVPVGVPMANYAIMHTFGGVLYIPTAWVSNSELFILQVFLGP